MPPVSNESAPPPQLSGLSGRQTGMRRCGSNSRRRGGLERAVFQVRHDHVFVVEVHWRGDAGRPGVIPHDHLGVLEQLLRAGARERVGIAGNLIQLRLAETIEARTRSSIQAGEGECEARTGHPRSGDTSCPTSTKHGSGCKTVERVLVGSIACLKRSARQPSA